MLLHSLQIRVSESYNPAFWIKSSNFFSLKKTVNILPWPARSPFLGYTKKKSLFKLCPLPSHELSYSLPDILTTSCVRTQVVLRVTVADCTDRRECEFVTQCKQKEIPKCKSNYSFSVSDISAFPCFMLYCIQILRWANTHPKNPTNMSCCVCHISIKPAMGRSPSKESYQYVLLCLLYKYKTCDGPIPIQGILPKYIVVSTI
jgi:hypothetical protein